MLPRLRSALIALITFAVNLLRAIRDSGCRGRVAILNHTHEDAEGRLADHMAGLEWTVRQVNGEAAGAKPEWRTYPK